MSHDSHLSSDRIILFLWIRTLNVYNDFSGNERYLGHLGKKQGTAPSRSNGSLRGIS